MEYILKPFIGIYHVVSYILNIPHKIISKTNDQFIESIDQKELAESRKESNVKSQEVETLEDNFAGLKKSKIEKAPKKKLVSYRYVVINSIGKKETGTFEAESESDVRNFLISQDYKVVSVELRKSYDIDLFISNKMKPSTLSFFLTQLSTYIKSGIPLVDSVRILAKQSTKPQEKKAFEKLVYELLKGEDLSEAMVNQGDTFPKLLINMIETAEMTGDLPSVLDDMADYYTSMDKTRKQMISAMTYPVVVLTIAIGVLVFMLVYLVPQFVGIYAEQDAELPAITSMIMGASNFIRANYIYILIAILILILVFRYLYRNVKSFKKGVQTFLMHVPVIKNIIIYNEVANFTKTFASLINHGVYITDSMEILSKITNNEVYKRIINNSLKSLGKGESISASFRGEWAFPIVAYEMLVTGENTGQLGQMMEKVADHFQTLHKNIIDQLKSLLEPLLICILALIVGVILLSIITPMFDIYGQIK